MTHIAGHLEKTENLATSRSMELRPKIRKGGEKCALFWKLQRWVARMVLNVMYG